MGAMIEQLLGVGAWMALLAAKATVLLVLALAASRLLRGHSARARHSLWTVTFAALAALPLLQAGLPDLPVPGLGWAGELSRVAGRTVPAATTPAAGRLALTVPSDSPADRPRAGQPAAFSADAARTAAAPGVAAVSEPAPWLRPIRSHDLLRGALAVLAGLWLAGTVAIGALLLMAVWKARRIAGRAPLVRHAGWLHDYDAVRAELGMRRAVAIRSSDAVDSPMAGGVLAPFVLLPRAALSWPCSRRLVVLRHELAHVREHDPLRALIARVAAALYWFHPLVWIAGRDAVLARESACDETVVELGTRPSLYATVLLELAGPAGRSPIPALVLPMIQRSLLETRLMSILESDRPRTGRHVLLATVAAASLAALSVAAAAPQEESVQEEAPPKVRVEVVEPAPVAPVVGEAPRVGVAVAPPAPATRVQTTAPEVVAAEPSPGLGAEPARAPEAPEVWSHRVTEPQVAPAPEVWSHRVTEPQVAPTPARAPAPAVPPVGEAAGFATAPVPAPAPAPAAVPAFAPDDPEACVWDRDGTGRFSGSMSITGDSENRVREAVGYRDGDRIIRKVVDGVTVCLSSRGPVSFRDDMAAIEAIAPGGRVLLATVEGGEVAEMEITGLSPQQARWRVNGRERAVDAAATEWRDSLMELVAREWQIGMLRGEASSLRGEMSAVRGQASSLRGELSSLRGEASSVRGGISSVRSEESALRGEVSGLRAQVGSMRGQISSHRGAISGLQAQRQRASEAESQSIDQKIAEHEAAIEAVEQQIEEFDLEAQIAGVEQQIEALDTEDRIEQLERELEQLEVGDRMEQVQARISAYEVESVRELERIQRELEELDVEARSSEIETEIEAAVARLRAAMQQIR